MGLRHSIGRFFGCRPESPIRLPERPIHPVFLRPTQNYYNLYGDSSGPIYQVLHRQQNGVSSISLRRLLQILIFGSSIYVLKLLIFDSSIPNAIKGLLQKFRFVFFLPRPGRTADPLLPIQNPVSSVSNEPSLVQTPLISSPSNHSSPDSSPGSGLTMFALVADLNTVDDRELQYDNVDVLYYQHWLPEENYDDRELQCDNVDILSSQQRYYDDRDLQCDNVDVLSYQQWKPEENYDGRELQCDNVGVLSFQKWYLEERELQCDNVDFLSSQQWHSDARELQCDNVDGLSYQKWWPEDNHDDRELQCYDNVDALSDQKWRPEENECDDISVLSSQQWWAEENYDDRELHCGNNDVLSSERLLEENYSPNRKETGHYMVVSIGGSLAYTGVSEEIICEDVFVEEENASRNVYFVEESVGVLDSIEWEKEEREEEKVKIRSVIVVDEERWIKHYSSRHSILLVGEGDFSFSASLAVAFGWASNIIATSLDSEEFLKTNYQRASSNINKLRSRESMVMHGIDATKMANNALLRQLQFDRIIFNFPYAGLETVKNLPRESQLRCHRELVGLFLKNAREMISENGEIHITHKTNNFHIEWKLESLASSQRLRLIEEVKFNYLDYPGYNTKYGFGGDKYFKCNPSKTYKFGLKSGWY